MRMLRKVQFAIVLIYDELPPSEYLRSYFAFSCRLGGVRAFASMLVVLYQGGRDPSGFGPDTFGWMMDWSSKNRC